MAAPETESIPPAMNTSNILGNLTLRIIVSVNVFESPPKENKNPHTSLNPILSEAPTKIENTITGIGRTYKIILSVELFFIYCC
jgi:hypothetical protein